MTDTIKTIRPVGTDDPVFQSAAYRRDIVAFNLVEMLRQSPCMLASDGETCVAAQSDPAYPAWVWTAEPLPDAARDALFAFLRDAFSETAAFNLHARRLLLAALEDSWRGEAVFSGYISMIAYDCPAVLLPESSEDIHRPAEEDVPAVALMLAGFERDCFGEDTMVTEALLRMARRCIASPDFLGLYANGTLAAIAEITSRDSGYARIGHVYTCEVYRRRGYAAALTSALARRALSEGVTPMLYTDAANPASNRAYRNVGFVPRGELARVDITWKTKK